MSKKNELLYSSSPLINIIFTMNKIIFSFLTTSLAGFSTLLGIIPCLLKKKHQNTILSFTLAFSSGIMLAISLISLIPESVFLLFDKLPILPVIIIASIFIVVGIILSFTASFEVDKFISDNKLYKLGIISIIVLIIHNIPEGITTFISTSVNSKLGIKLAIAIALHNIPEGISIAVPIYYATNNLKKAFSYTFIAGFSELLGSIIAYLFLANYITNFSLAIILSVTAGIMIHISLYELLPTSLQYKKKKISMLAFLLGIITMFICDLFF